MLSGKQTISTFTNTNLVIWMVLAFQAGTLNIGGLLACHSFVSHVTGFATLLGADINRTGFRSATPLLLVPFSFLAGAVLSGFLIDLRLRKNKSANYAVVFGLIMSLLLAVVIAGFNGFFGDFGSHVESTHDYTLVLVLCLICGLQNGTVTLVSRSVVRTTHLTGLTTDLGIGISRLISWNTSAERHEEVRANWMRVAIILSFTLGSTLGYSLFTRFAYRGFIVPTIIYAFLFGVFFWRPRCFSA